MQQPGRGVSFTPVVRSFSGTQQVPLEQRGQFQQGVRYGNTFMGVPRSNLWQTGVERQATIQNRRNQQAPPTRAEWQERQNWRRGQQQQKRRTGTRKNRKTRKSRTRRNTRR